MQTRPGWLSVVADAEEAHAGWRLFHRDGDQVRRDISHKHVFDQAACGLPVLVLARHWVTLSSVRRVVVRVRAALLFARAHVGHFGFLAAFSGRSCRRVLDLGAGLVQPALDLLEFLHFSELVSTGLRFPGRRSSRGNWTFIGVCLQILGDCGFSRRDDWISQTRCCGGAASRSVTALRLLVLKVEGLMALIGGGALRLGSPCFSTSYPLHCGPGGVGLLWSAGWAQSVLSGSLNRMFGGIHIQSSYSFGFTSSRFQIQTSSTVPAGDGQLPLGCISDLVGFVQGQRCGLDWRSPRSRWAGGGFNRPTLGQRAPVRTRRRIFGWAAVETHEGEARRMNRLLDRPWKIRFSGALQDFARTLVLLELLRLRRQGLPVSLPQGLLLRHDDLRLLLRDGM